jgi:hypothetical protein
MMQRYASRFSVTVWLLLLFHIVALANRVDAQETSARTWSFGNKADRFASVRSESSLLA